ncbi:GntR family transcriptional regulator [Flavonifractor plautii]|nr:GntR family transcriptional regulator [Flavonifractor plautii]
MLKDNIVRLELKPGSLVSENELAAEMGLSRTPVREALIELSKVKIVEIYPQRGAPLPALIATWWKRPSLCAGCWSAR